MAIRYPSSGTIVTASIAADTKALIIDNLKDELVNAGWTSTGVGSYVVLTFTGNPSNNETVTFDGVTYTFKTTINNANPREVLIGAGASANASNLAAAITAGAGSGTNYSSATTAHATCTASANSGAVTVTYSTGGTSGIGKTASESLSNATLDSTTFRYGGYKVDSVETPHGLQMRLYLYEENTTNVFLRAMAVDQSVSNTSSIPQLAPAGGRVLRVVANAHQCFVWLEGSSTTGQGTTFCCGTPYIREPQRGIAVTGAADNGSGLVRLTVTGHGLTTGNSVDVREVQIGGSYSSSINGTWTVTVIDANTLDLQASTWPGGTYTASTGVLAGPNKISRAIFSMGGLDSAAGTGFNWRTNPSYQCWNGGQAYIWCCLNASHWQGVSANAVLCRLILPLDQNGAISQNYGQYSDLAEARIAWPVTSHTSTCFIIGDLWAAFVVGAAVNMDVTQTGFDGHDWINFIHNNSKASLWLATS